MHTGESSLSHQCGWFASCAGDANLATLSEEALEGGPVVPALRQLQRTPRINFRRLRERSNSKPAETKIKMSEIVPGRGTAYTG